MNTLINLIISAAFQFSGSHIAQQQMENQKLQLTSQTIECCIVPKDSIINNEQFCKETITQ